MKIVVAPDKLKGSMTASEACRALQTGARRVFPDAEIVSVPLADGGEGTLDALLANAGGLIKTQTVRGPLGEMVAANWVILPDGRAVIEMAQASGLHLTAPEQRDALRASSFGTGQLIKAALNAGCREIIIGLGGSATSDGGIGALSALGLFARDANQRILPPGGAALANLSEIDRKFFDARLEQTSFTILCDVDNPLTGPQGAARVYATQKGAAASEIVQLEEGLEHFANLTKQIAGKDGRHHRGAGAAGGTAFGLMTFCNAQLRSGIDFVLEMASFNEKIAGAQFILTAEGSLDAQTLNGKTIAGVCQAARTQSIPVLGFAGKIQLNAQQLNALGLLSAFPLTERPQSMEYCLQNAAVLLADSAEHALRSIKL